MVYFKKHLTSLILLVLGLTAFIRGILFLDPDFGWHLRMGELILQKGIPLTDPFSYTMSSYPFVDHEWLLNVLISIGVKSVGIYGLALIFALIFISALFLAIPKQFKNYSTLPLALAGGAMLGFTGIRTQVVTWFFLALLLKVIFDESLWKKWKLFIPLIFILWVNLHGGFAVGIVILFLIFIFKSWQNKKFELGYFGITLFSVILTFVNPYGPRIWWEIWQQISDGNLKWHIAEWSPGFFDTDIALLALFALSFSFLLRYKAKIGKIPVIIYLFLLLMAVSALRQIPLWALSAVFVVSAAIKLLMAEVGNNKYARERLKKATKILFVIIFVVFVFEIITSILGVLGLSEQKYYPAKAVVYLSRQNFVNGNLFTLYDYGGYLIWKLPNRKVFIDGRMPSWRRDGIFPNESNYAFKDYLKMLGDEGYFMQMVEKYNIHYVLLSNPLLNNKKLSPLAAKLENITEKFVLWKTNTKVVGEDLTKLGFKKIYNDGHFVIYKI
jgi:hypothetical protein